MADLIALAKAGNDKEIEKALQSLLKEQARVEINQPDNNKQTALHAAAANNHLSTVELLIKYGADVNALNRNGETPLHLAANKNLSAIGKSLLEHGAKCDIKRNDYCNVAHAAATVGAIETLKVILDHDRDLVTSTSKENRTPFFCALINDETAVLKILLDDYQDDVNQTSAYEFGKTALHMAVMKNKDDVVLLLLDHGADVDKQDGQKFTALQRCAMLENPSIEIAKKLIDKGADGERAVDILEDKFDDLTAKQMELYEYLSEQHSHTVTNSNDFRK